MVIDFIKKKLPTPVGAQINEILGNDAAVKTSQNVFGILASDLEKRRNREESLFQIHLIDKTRRKP
jgi:hypothetical protein